jgi:hypothetical protein
MPQVHRRVRPRHAAAALVIAMGVAACAPPGTPIPGEPGSIFSPRQAGGKQPPLRPDTDPIERGPNPAVIGRPAS